ncbi:NAD(P)/FAD-dependent oxidoreductase [Thiolapillus sp.]
MSSATHYDYLIIGQGLAGSLLAWRLAQKGRRVLVLDDGHATASSMVAAGLINPLAGMRFNHSPFIHHWLGDVAQTYHELAGLAGEEFLQWLDMLRLFRSPEQQRFFERQKGKKEIEDLLGARLEAENITQPVQAPWGGFEQHHTGWVRLPRLLEFLSRWLRTRGMLRNATVSWKELEMRQSGLCWKDIHASHVVFCDGYRSMHNPWFSWLPFAPDQGEILTLKPVSSAPLPDRIINGANWLLPVDDHHFRLGATHYHDRQDNLATQTGQQRLLQGMNKLLLYPEALEVIRADAGVRPATSDRQPFLGTHPQHRRLHLFNGFGAHGSLSIPWYARRMTDWLIEQRPLPDNADLLRHRNLLLKS